MSNYYHRNTNSRTNLDNNLQQYPLFKTVYPTFDEWKKGLMEFGVSENDIKEDDFKFINIMISSAKLIYTTADRNKAYTAFKFKQYQNQKNREKELYDKGLTEMLKPTSKQTTSLYNVDRSEQNVVTDNFLDNRVVQEAESAPQYIDYLDQIARYLSMKDPEQTFVIRLASAIVLPVQPTSQEENI